MNRTIYLILCVILITACGDKRNPKLKKYSDDWINKEVKRCDTLANPSRIKALACNNYKKECTARSLSC